MSLKFILIKKVVMPTIVGILTFISRIKLIQHQMDLKQKNIYFSFVYFYVQGIFMLSSKFYLFDLVLYVPSTIFQLNR